MSCFCALGPPIGALNRDSSSKGIIPWTTFLMDSTPPFLSLGKSFKIVMCRIIPMAWFWTLITPSECVCIFVCGHLCHWKDARATEIQKDNTKTLHLASGNGHVQLVYILIQAGGEVNQLPQMVNFCNLSSLFFAFKGQEETFLKFSYINGLTGAIHLEDKMSFRDELFRPGGQNLAWKFVLRKEAEKFVLFWGLIFWGQNFEDELCLRPKS